MKNILGFGEKVEGYHVNVLNEREARSASGILFLFAIIAFMNALLLGNFIPIKVFVLVFFIDFFIRVLINPKYSPTLILARLIVSNQNVEYTGAPQKRFAWSLGLVLSAVMSVLIVGFNLRGPWNLGICLLCLTLLFFEVAFGICIGCKMYNAFTKKKAQHCPGGVCQMKFKAPIQIVSIVQKIILGIFALLVGLLIYLFF